MKSLLLYACFALTRGLINDEQVSVITGSGSTATKKPENDPRFKPIESHYLTFPVVADDFARWQTYEDAVFLKSKVMLAPEAPGSSGIL